MGSSSRRKDKRKRKISNDDIAAYRERDKMEHRRKRQGMLNISQVDDELIEGEIIKSDNEYVQLGNENVPIENDNVEIENLENENFEDEMLPSHNRNCIIDHVEDDNAQEPNAQEPYISPNYNRHEGSKTPKWITEIDETIITSLEGKKSKRTIQLWASRLY